MIWLRACAPAERRFGRDGAEGIVGYFAETVIVREMSTAKPLILNLFICFQLLPKKTLLVILESVNKGHRKKESTYDFESNGLSIYAAFVDTSARSRSN